VETDDGHTIRIGNEKKVVSYCIDGEEFHRLRNSVPDKLRQTLKLSKVKAGDNDQFDVHFGEQKSPIFLLGERGSRAASFFASSSDASVLIEMQKLHRGKVKSAQQEFQRQKRESKQTSEILEVLAPVPDLESKLDALDKTYAGLLAENQQIQQWEVLIQELQRSSQVVAQLEQTVATLNLLPGELQQEPEKPLELLAQRLGDVKQQVKQTQFKVVALADLAEPPVLADIVLLSGLINDIQREEHICDRAKATGDCLLILSDPPQLTDTDLLQKLIEKIQSAEARSRIDRAEFQVLENCSPPPVMADLLSMEHACQRWEEAQLQVEKLQQVYQKCEAEHEAVRAKLVDWVKANPTCPTCGTELEPEQFIQTAEMGLEGHTHGT